MAILDLDFQLELPAFTVAAELAVAAETLALVGPSGAGKTTVLRAVAGLAGPDRGRISCGGRAWFDAAAEADLPPEERSVGLVFQDYALFPHLSVRRNVAFGSRPGGVDVGELLERFRISPLADAKPRTLSGGERQRVALARALARQPEVLLLDEPLSALDAHTRALVRAELRELLDGLGLPTILITHDFRDAAALATRAAAIVDGEIRQSGTVAELASDPADAFVATLTGSNVLAATATRVDGVTWLVLESGQRLAAAAVSAEGPVDAIVAPWDVRVPAADAPAPANALRGRVTALTRFGSRVEARVGPLAIECGAGEAEAAALREGAEAVVEVPAAAIAVVSRRSRSSSAPAGGSPDR